MRGWPDYTRVTGLVDNYDEFAQNYSVGIGDGAARLGSIKTYDMRGRAKWMDDFEAGVLHWDTAGVGAGGAQGLVSDYVKNGEQALGLTSATGAGRLSRALRILSIPREVAIGIEFSYAQEANFGRLEVLNMVYDGINRTSAWIAINEAANHLEYENAAPVWIDSGVDLGLSDELIHFHTVKTVFDYATDEWMRILYDDQEVHMNREPMNVDNMPGPRSIWLEFRNIGDDVNNARIIIDDIILTVMEPE